MNIVSRTITGLVMVVGGIVLLVIALFNGLKGGAIMALIYGLPLLVAGFFILFNKKEDKIEQMRSVKGGKK